MCVCIYTHNNLYAVYTSKLKASPVLIFTKMSTFHVFTVQLLGKL